MKISFTPIAKFTFCLIIGIIISHYSEVIFHNALKLLISIFIVILIFYLKGLFFKSVHSLSFDIVTITTFIFIGVFSYSKHHTHLYQDHYTHYIKPTATTTLVTLKIKTQLASNAYNHRFITEVKAVDTIPVSGKLLLNIHKDSLYTPMTIDDEICIATQLATVKPPLNPFQFDYKAYLNRKQIHHQVFINSEAIIAQRPSETTIYGLANALRTRINEKLKTSSLSDEAVAMVNALVLGQRQHIDRNLYDNYVKSGTIHILAVSGLHVGILLWILNIILQPLTYIKKGRHLRLLLSILVLWSFAVITGLSPSVVRAVAMFSVIAVALNFKRSTNIYNTLAISAFFMLLINPSLLFEVGFQMSYLAVIAIVSVQPIIYRWWQPKYYIIDKLWQIFTVTIAAQIGVAPVSLFYFHQFPGLFFVSNLIVIPFLGIILGLGILIVCLTMIDQAPQFLNSGFNYIITALNRFISWISGFDSFLFRNISFNIFHVVICYLFIIAVLYQYKKSKIKLLLYGLICCSAFMLVTKFSNYKDAFIVFNKHRHSIIGIKQGRRLYLSHNMDSTTALNDFTIKNYNIGSFTTLTATDSLQTVYQYNGKLILVIEHLGRYNIKGFKPNYVLLRNAPKINLNRLIEGLNPELIIADASNYTSYANRWRQTCQDKKIPFHYTNEKGAFILH